MVNLSRWSLDGFCQEINWNRDCHIINGWTDLPVGSKLDIVYNESVHEYIKKNINIFSPQSSEKASTFIKQRWRYVNQHYIIMHIYIYQIGAFNFTLLVKIQDTCSIQLAGVGDNIGTSWLLILVLSPSKYNSPVGLCSN